MKVLNIGSLNIDYVYQVAHIVKEGETISSSSLEVFPGGKGLNQSVALARAGVKVYHAGRIGNDGLFLKEICIQSGVDVKHLELVETRTGNAIVQVNHKGQNSIILYPGANYCLDRQYLDIVLQDFTKGDILLLQNEVNNLEYIMEIAIKKEMKIFLNPSPFDKNIMNLDLDKVHTFLLNEIEGYQLTNKKEPVEILEEIKKLYPNTNVVLTLGDKGVYFQDQNIQLYQPANKVEVVDTTAAGDTFTGYYIASIIQGKTMEEALLLATKASSLAISRKGATSSIPYFYEVIKK